jgi:hypothetical protein
MTLLRNKLIQLKKTLNKCYQLLDYCATYPNAIIRYNASDMVLHVDSDAAYFVLPGAHSRIAGYYFLSSELPPDKLGNVNPAPNGPILVECHTLTHVVASAAEAETGGLFYNGKTIIPIWQALIELGHPQPPTPLKTDNSTATGFVHKSTRQKRSKSWDMRFHWLHERRIRQQLNIFWDRGSKNKADYFTKHHPPKYHRFMRPKIIQMLNQLIKARSACCKGVLNPSQPGININMLTWKVGQQRLNSTGLQSTQ